MIIFQQLLLNGLIAGAIYSLVASGFALIYSTNKFLHFAHGGVIAFSGYMLYYFFSLLGLGFYFSALLTIIFAAILGYLINNFIYQPLRDRKTSDSILLVSSIAVLVLCESLIVLLFGADVKTVDFLAHNQVISLGQITITPLQIMIITTAVILFLALIFIMKKTKIGKAMKAVADNKNMAAIIGISTKKIYNWSFIIGSAMAGTGAVLIALEQNLEPNMGVSLIIKGFTATVIGGIGSVPGAILGAFLLGIIENFGIWYLPSGYKDAIAFVLLFLFLLFRPQGILGVKQTKND